MGRGSSSSSSSSSSVEDTSSREVSGQVTRGSVARESGPLKSSGPRGWSNHNSSRFCDMAVVLGPTLCVLKVARFCHGSGDVVLRLDAALRLLSG